MFFDKVCRKNVEILLFRLIFKTTFFIFLSLYHIDNYLSKDVVNYKKRQKNKEMFKIN